MTRCSELAPGFQDPYPMLALSLADCRHGDHETVGVRIRWVVFAATIMGLTWLFDSPGVCTRIPRLWALISPTASLFQEIEFCRDSVVNIHVSVVFSSTYVGGGFSVFSQNSTFNNVDGYNL